MTLCRNILTDKVAAEKKGVKFCDQFFFQLRENVPRSPPSDTKSQHYYDNAVDKKAIDGLPFTI